MYNKCGIFHVELNMFLSNRKLKKKKQSNRPNKSRQEYQDQAEDIVFSDEN